MPSYTKERPVATVVAELSMSLDGFVADPADAVGPLFDWYYNGDVTVPMPDPRWILRTSAASAAHLRDTIANAGALVCGRRLFDYAKGWGGNHPTGVPVFVVTHSVPAGWPRQDAPFTFVTAGVDSALDQARIAAGEKVVTVASPNIAQQYLNSGLLDEVRVCLVPVLFGRGIRFFDNLTNGPIDLDGPTVIEGDRVTHLSFRVRKAA
jgi:dihydrofolate reductase